MLLPPSSVWTDASFAESSSFTIFSLLYDGLPSILVRTGMGKDSMYASGDSIFLGGRNVGALPLSY